MLSNRYIKKIRNAANIGLYGSLLICICVVAEHFLDKYLWVREITTNDYTHRLFLIVGLVLAVSSIAYVLFAMRKGVPRLRQTDGVENKLSGYAKLIGNTYYLSLFSVIVVGAIVVILRENTLIMLLLLLFLLMMLNYPNMYKMKVDLGLDDDEMTELFGSSYIKGEGDKK